MSSELFNVKSTDQLAYVLLGRAHVNFIFNKLSMSDNYVPAWGEVLQKSIYFLYNYFLV